MFDSSHPPHAESPTYDVIVVGGRAAGAVTAMLLARHGLHVLVVDRSDYAADTMSTHALMRGGVIQLHRWDLLDRVIAAGTPPIRRTTFVYGRDRVDVAIKPSHGVDALYARAVPCSTRSWSTRRSTPGPRSGTASPSSTCFALATAP